MELIKNKINIGETAVKGSTKAMADGDMIVPDIKPDILKLLQVDAEACVTDKYIENGRLVVCGRVDYKILYVPDKEKENIKSIMTAMEFRQAVDAAGADGAAALVNVSVERVEFNAVNSRKLRLRAIIAIDYELRRVKETEICAGVDDDSAETKTNTMELEETVNISFHDFSVKETIDVPSGQASVNELLKTDARLSDLEYKTVTGKIIVKGCVCICILYTAEDGDVKFIENEAPFTEVFDAEGVGENTVCDIDYAITGIMAEVSPDNDGDMRTVTVDTDIEASVVGTESVNVDVLEDCFVPCRKTVCESEDIPIVLTLERVTAQNTLRETVDFPSGAPAVSGVYNVMTDAHITKAELQRGRIVSEGKLEMYILYVTDSEENPVYSIKKDIPFSYMLECSEDYSDADTDIKAVARHVSYNLNSSGALEIRCLLSLEGIVRRHGIIRSITSAETGDEAEKRGIIICFTHDGDDLWSVAKRYRIPCGRIRECNDCDCDNLTAGMKLFIPSK